MKPIVNFSEGNPSSGNNECNAIVEFCEKKDIEQVTRHERIQKELIEWAGNEDEKAAPKSDSLKELSKQCARMYKPARAVQNQRYFKSRQETLGKYAGSKFLSIKAFEKVHYHVLDLTFQKAITPACWI